MGERWGEAEVFGVSHGRRGPPRNEEIHLEGHAGNVASVVDSYIWDVGRKEDGGGGHSYHRIRIWILDYAQGI